MTPSKPGRKIKTKSPRFGRKTNTRTLKLETQHKLNTRRFRSRYNKKTMIMNSRDTPRKRL